MRRRVGAIDLGVEITGSGPALVLLHAFPLDRRMWTDAVAALSATHRVIALDARGFGESALGDDPPALERLADDVIGLLDSLGVPMASVLGLSMGGYVALALAARHPARLASLILCDTRAGADSPEGKRGRDQAIAAVRADLTAYLDAMPKRLLGPRADASTVVRTRALMDARLDGVVWALAAMRDRPDRSAELSAIDCPTLVVVGVDDAMTPPAEARAMAGAIRGARLIEIPTAGHLSNLEAPAAFNLAVAEFLITYC
jgi:pimeloyl-ACP methyl ester carboxylesterase